MKTLNDCILDIQERETYFLRVIRPTNSQGQTHTASRNTAQKIEDTIQPNYVSADGIPCHNRATQNFYNNKK